MSKIYSPIRVVAAVSVLLLASSFTSTGVAFASEEPAYVVEEGLVDKATFNGYRRFHGTCHACHGQDAMGGSFAPALVESLKDVSYDAFVETVMNGRQATASGGAVSAMPGFSKDPNITKHLDDIYRYLKARSDGVLPPGRPEKMPKKK